MCEYTGYSRKEFLDLSPFDLLADPVSGDGDSPYDNYPAMYEARIRGKNGRVFWVLANASYVHENGRPVRATVIAHDITERKQVLEALRESEEKFATAFRSNPGAISLARLDDGRIVDVNQGFTAMYGWSPEEAIGNTNIGLNLFLNPEKARERLRLLQEQGMVREFEFKFKHKNGEIGTALNSAEIIEIGGRPHLLSISQDITLRKKAEEEAMRLATAIEQAAEDILITDTAGAIVYVNPAFERLNGYRKEEVLGKTPRLLKSGRHGPAFYRDLWKTITAGRVWASRITNKTKKGDMIELEGTISPIFDAHGAIAGFVSVKRDITDQIKLEAQLRQAHKMEALGTLAGGIAHDFNNILTIILGYTQMAHRQAKTESVKDNLSQIMAASLRAMDLVKRILTFSRQTEHELRPVDLAEIIDEALQLLRPSLPSTIEIQTSITTDRAMALADPTQLHQILMNLCSNAFHAMRDAGGKLEIGLRNLIIMDQDTSFGGQITPGRYLLLTVSDTGSGIDARILDRIFDPYFTTKGVGEGTGLGLSVVHGIVKSYGGAIRAYSELGHGTSFHVYLPSITDEAESGGKLDAAIPGGSETLLFVDDEEALAEVGKEMLESLGYRVEVRTSSHEALMAFKANPDRYDLVITDHILPQMTGLELAREIRGIRDEIPIILCTGFATSISREKAKALGISRYMLKPYLFGEMARTVREVLDGK